MEYRLQKTAIQFFMQVYLILWITEYFIHLISKAYVARKAGSYYQCLSTYFTE
jgi:hypothetical protein